MKIDNLPEGFYLKTENASLVEKKDAFLDECFFSRRSGPCHAIRLESSQILSLSYLVFSDKDEIIANIQIWSITAGDVPAALMGPLVVDPKFRGLGLGKYLTNLVIEQAKAENIGALFLIGDRAYYEKFGFSHQLTKNFYIPQTFGSYDPNRFLAMELKQDYLKNISGCLLPAKITIFSN
ncbi:GNAT family N-acetyltransferase [Bartonella sp. DGB1]|uniref:GNAT family N-acetyltransferase n=1 Tax=Bartonella sp. DGB1 TaxID=3239807 RepID=UPI003524B5A9